MASAAARRPTACWRPLPWRNRIPRSKPCPPHRPLPPRPPVDFIGISGYAPITRPLSFSAMEISWETAAYEFDLFGISVKQLAAKGKRLIYRCGGGAWAGRGGAWAGRAGAWGREGGCMGREGGCMGKGGGVHGERRGGAWGRRGCMGKGACMGNGGCMGKGAPGCGGPGREEGQTCDRRRRGLRRWQRARPPCKTHATAWTPCTCTLVTSASAPGPIALAIPSPTNCPAGPRPGLPLLPGLGRHALQFIHNPPARPPPSPAPAPPASTASAAATGTSLLRRTCSL